MAALKKGSALRDAIAALDPRLIAEADLAAHGDPQRIALNVNSPEDLELAALADRLTGSTVTRAL